MQHHTRPVPLPRTDVIDREGGNVDVVLTDVLMPEISGFELLINLIQQPQYAHIAIILMSSSSSQAS